MSADHSDSQSPIDSDVQNDVTYYYMIEDVASNGGRTLHGPTSATPSAAGGPVPAAGSGTNSGSNPGGITPAPTDPNIIELGNGARILSRTRRSLRLEIVPPAPTLSPSVWNAAYSTLSAPGYSSV